MIIRTWYNICNARFSDNRISTCFSYSLMNLKKFNQSCLCVQLACLVYLPYLPCYKAWNGSRKWKEMKRNGMNAKNDLEIDQTYMIQFI